MADNTRVLHLMDEITLEAVRPLIQKIIEINRNDDEKSTREPIHFHLYTNGGRCYAGLALVDAILASQTPVHVHTYGMIASMGIPIALAGHYRFGHRHTRFMYHGVTSGTGGTLPQMEVSLNEAKNIQELLDKLIIERTHITDDLLAKHRDTSNDWWIDAELALKLGIIHEIKN